MSLMDTIKAARSEAEEAGTLPVGNKKAAGTTKATESSQSSASGNEGFSRRSTARAKPRRERAGSVHTEGASKPKSEMTKEEKKAKKEEDRQTQDLVLDTKSVILKQMPEYQRSQRIWWAMLIGGIVLTITSYLLSRVVANGGNDVTSSMAMVSVFCMVGAYVLVIGAFIYDLVKVRPLRNAANEKLTTMSKKRMQRFLKEEKEGAKK